MRPKDVFALLVESIKAKFPVMLTGQPGVGKTDIVKAVAKAVDHALIVCHLVVYDATDMKGIPYPSADGETARWLPYGVLKSILGATTPTVVFFDDMGQAPASVQASTMQLLLERAIDGHKVPDCVTFVAATNRRTDKAGVGGILEPVKSRFVTIVNVDAHVDDWCEWALDNGIDPMMVAFHRLRGSELLSAFKPSADMTQSPTPRTWVHCDRITKLKLPFEVMREAAGGSVGADAAGEYFAFREIVAQLPNPDALLMDPDKAMIPNNPSALYAVATALGAKANVNTFDSIARYAERLVGAGRGEFAALMIQDSLRRCVELMHTPAWVKLATGPLGDLVGCQ
jgi:hypothetical protein